MSFYNRNDNQSKPSQKQKKYIYKLRLRIFETQTTWTWFGLSNTTDKTTVYLKDIHNSGKANVRKIHAHLDKNPSNVHWRKRAKIRTKDKQNKKKLQRKKESRESKTARIKKNYLLGISWSVAAGLVNVHENGSLLL